MSFISAILGGKDGAVKGLINKAKKIKSDRQADTSSPGHTHNSESKERRNAAEAKRSDSGSVNIGSMANASSFMGKGQVDQFSNLTDPSSVDRGGRTVARPDDSSSLDPVGIATAMNPPMAVPTTPNIDEEGVQSLYS